MFQQKTLQTAVKSTVKFATLLKKNPCKKELYNKKNANK